MHWSFISQAVSNFKKVSCLKNIYYAHELFINSMQFLISLLPFISNICCFKHSLLLHQENGRIYTKKHLRCLKSSFYQNKQRKSRAFRQQTFSDTLTVWLKKKGETRHELNKQRNQLLNISTYKCLKCQFQNGLPNCILPSKSKYQWLSNITMQ